MAVVIPVAYYVVTLGFTVVGGLIGGLVGHKIGNSDTIEMEYEMLQQIFDP